MDMRKALRKTFDPIKSLIRIYLFVMHPALRRHAEQENVQIFFVQ